MSFIEKAKIILQQQNYKICPQDSISSGNFGSVILIEDDQNQSLAVKVVQIQQNNQPQQQYLQSSSPSMVNLLKYEEALEEANLLNAARHQNIVRFETHFIKDDLSFLIMERAKENLEEYVINNYSESLPDEKQFLKIMTQLVDGLVFLHEQKFVIRDIKLENILVFEENQFKFCDFGLSKRYFTNDDFNTYFQSSLKGNSISWPPEIYQIFEKTQIDKDYLKKNKISQTQKGDVWALGIVLLQILGKKIMYLFGLLNENSQIDDFINLGKDVNEIIKWMMTKNEQNRPTIKEVQKKLKKVMANRKSEKYRVQAIQKYLKDLDISKANELFLKAINIDQENSYAYSSYALFLTRNFDNQKKQEIDKNTDIALSLNSKNQEAILLQILRIENVDERIKQKEKMNLDDPLVIVSLGLDYYQTKNYEIAERYFLESIEKFPNYARAYYNLANIYIYQQNNNEKGIEILLQGLYRDMSDSNFLTKIAQTYEGQGEYKQAEKYFKIAINSNTNDTESYHQYSQFLHYNKKDLTKALEMYQQQIKINPQLYQPYYEIGKIYNKLKNEFKAEEYLNQALKINSKSFDSHQFMMIVISNSQNYQNRKDEVTYHFNKAREIDPKDARLYLVYAELIETKYQDIKIALQYYKEGYQINLDESIQKHIQRISKILKNEQ